MTRHRSITRRRFLGEAGKYTTGLAVLGSALPVAEMPAAAQSGNAGPPSGVLISKLSRFVAGVRYDAIPPKALDTARIAIMDCLGVAVAGGTEESARIAGRLAREDGGKETTTLYGQRFKLPTVQATLVNGIAAHAHDFDHSFVVGGQPTSSIIPASFTLGESIGASGRHVLEAYTAGFELVGAMMFALQNAGGTGWHANGTVGVFGAAAASAKLLGLTPAQIETALAISTAASERALEQIRTLETLASIRPLVAQLRGTQ